jgi:hypothetical protein
MAGMCNGSSKVQSVLFQRGKWSPAEARMWLRTHRFVHPKVDSTRGFHRFRQFDPSGCARGTFRTITFSSRKGIKAVACCPKRALKLRRAA